MKFQYLKPELKGCTDEQWADFYKLRVQKQPRWACIQEGAKLYRRKLWKLGKKSVQKYILDGMRR